MKHTSICSYFYIKLLSEMFTFVENCVYSTTAHHVDLLHEVYHAGLVTFPKYITHGHISDETKLDGGHVRNIHYDVGKQRYTTLTNLISP